MQWNKRVIAILAHFTWCQHKQRWKRRLNIKYSFSYTWFLKTKWRQRQLSNVITSPQRHIYACATFSRTKASAKWSVTSATHSSVTSSKSHVQKARESHDLNMDFAASTNSYARMVVLWLWQTETDQRLCCLHCIIICCIICCIIFFKILAIYFLLAGVPFFIFLFFLGTI